MRSFGRHKERSQVIHCETLSLDLQLGFFVGHQKIHPPKKWVKKWPLKVACRIHVVFFSTPKSNQIIQVSKLWKKMPPPLVLSRKKPWFSPQAKHIFSETIWSVYSVFLEATKFACMYARKKQCKLLIRLRLQSVILHSNDTHPNVPPRNHATATASAGFPITKLKSILWFIHRPLKANISQRKIHRKTPQICIIIDLVIL